MLKEKVLSVRLREDQIEKLDELSKAKNTTKSKFIRKLVNTYLKADENGKKVYQVKVQPEHNETLEELAEENNIKPEKYLRKLVKSHMDPDGSGGMIAKGGVSQEEYNNLEKDFKELYNRNEDLSTKYEQLEIECKENENTIDELNKVKDELLNELMFAKKGSGVLISLFETAMKNSEVMMQMRDLLTDSAGKPSEDYNIIMKTKKLLEAEN